MDPDESSDCDGTTAIVLDQNGGPLVPMPAEYTFMERLRRNAILYVIMPIFGPPVMAIALLRGKLVWDDIKQLFWAVKDAAIDPVNRMPYYQDRDLLSKVYRLPSAKHYIQRNALEWQKQEGYCAPATLRCVLKSFDCYPLDMLPPQVSGPSHPEKWCSAIKELADKKHEAMPSFHTEITSGDEPYESFLASLRKVNDDKYRVVVNFLRPVLFGFKNPWWHPTHLVFGLFGGHFSPVIGILETKEYGSDNPLVAIFDVNHSYGGTYLVPAKRLYQSVRAKDIATHNSRAVVILSQ